MTDSNDPSGQNKPRLISALRLDERFNAATAVSARTDYFGLTKTLTYSYLFVLPLFLLYEFGMLILHGMGSNVRIGADVLIRHVLALVGIESTLWFGVLVMIAGAVIVAVERRKGIKLKLAWFGGMLAESTVYAIVVGMAVSTLVGAVFAAAPPLQIAGTSNMLEGLVLSLGAGLYEELLFRLILVSGLFAILRLLPISKTVSYTLAAVIGAIIFSWVHYIGPLGYEFTVSSFVFRALMGLALNGLFLARGFGIAAMTHAIYDVIVTIMA
ncbi:MAG: CPBP family intramembrane metalloprotease [bacterium]|nr:CPBP family intramembrane metalloprotease [Candidatus Kapabacteria bacterium]